MSMLRMTPLYRVLCSLALFTLVRRGLCSSVTSQKFQKNQNKKFIGTILLTLSFRSELDCCITCLNNDLNCRSINYNNVDLTCELLNVSQSETVQPGWTSVVVVEPGCEGDWFQFEDKCYLQVLTTSNWIVSKTWCEALGGTLASLYTSEIFDFIVTRVSTGGAPRYWVGGYDYNGNNQGFKWMNGDVVDLDFFGWKSGEPNNGGERCMELYRYGSTYKFNDHQCSNSYASLCERSLV